MKGKIAATTPFPQDVEQGKTYYWCACGLSKKQPFCDGSHKGTEFSPIAYHAEKNQIVFFCGCKQSSRQPICDGTHSKLPSDQGEPNNHR
ncbi:MAG: CDGSH iron-sulfur domain-containing protein [Alcanivoracaceae bacterium]|nr:CDGSH iron-sulfur domain-containing protein [Alcanivoracaceae bacterium]